MKNLTELLEYFEENLDNDQVEKAFEKHKKSIGFEEIAQPPLMYSYPKKDRGFYCMSEIHEDMEKMMYNELVACLGSIELKDDSLPMIRANYGVGILPSLFGAHCKIIQNNMPWVDSIGSEHAIKELIARGIPDLDEGFGQKITQTHAFYKERLAPYPKCREHIKIYHPDLQGPFDAAHLLWGSDIYYALYDQPELVLELMELITQTYIAFMERCFTEISDCDDGFQYHWRCLFPGKVLLRNDSVVNLSKEMYLELVKPFDERILTAFGSGSIHFCGRADHLVFDMSSIQGNRGMNFGYMPNVQFGQSFLEFTEENYKKNKTPIIQYYLTADEAYALDTNRFHTGISFQIGTGSREQALQIQQDMQVRF